MAGELHTHGVAIWPPVTEPQEGSRHSTPLHASACERANGRGVMPRPFERDALRVVLVERRQVIGARANDATLTRERDERGTVANGAGSDRNRSPASDTVTERGERFRDAASHDAPIVRVGAGDVQYAPLPNVRRIVARNAHALRVQGIGRRDGSRNGRYGRRCLRRALARRLRLDGLERLANDCGGLGVKLPSLTAILRHVTVPIRTEKRTDAFPACERMALTEQANGQLVRCVCLRHAPNVMHDVTLRIGRNYVSLRYVVTTDARRDVVVYARHVTYADWTTYSHSATSRHVRQHRHGRQHVVSSGDVSTSGNVLSVLTTPPIPPAPPL